MKSTAQTVIIWLFLIFVTGSSLYLYIHEQGNTKRLIYDLKAARDSAQTFTTKDGHQASKLISQNLTASELRKVNPEIVSKLKNMYITPGAVQSYTEATQTLQADISAPVKDSIKQIPGKAPEQIKTFAYSDKWLSLKGVIHHDTTAIKLAATDTIFTAVYKGERRHPWAWFLSKRQYTATATNRSPYIKINVIQSGVIKK